MTYVICEPCIDVKDNACVDVCPVDCIHPHPTNAADEYETVNQLYIDPEECIDCGICEPACPVEAIYMEEDVPEEWGAFHRHQRRLFSIDSNGLAREYWYLVLVCQPIEKHTKGR